jgi:hypothetical protein
MHKEGFIISRNTLLHVSTLLSHLQGELFCYLYTKVVLYSWVRMCCWLCTALFSEEWTLCGPGLHSVPCPCTILCKNTNHQQMHKEGFIINRNTLLHVSTLLGLSGSLELSAVRARLGPDPGEFTQSTAQFNSKVKFNPSVTVTKNSPWRWSIRVETCRSVLRLMIKLFVHLLVISVFV